MRLPNLLASKWGRLATFYLLYVTEGLPYGFATVAVATKMRSMSVRPAMVNVFVAVIVLPWAWKWAIGPFVDTLSRRIASFPVGAVEMAKRSVDAAEKPLRDGLTDEAFFFQLLLRTDDAQRNMKKFLELGGQTREGELNMPALAAEVGRSTGRED